VAVAIGGSSATVRTGSVAIAAITSCTNTSNPTVMIGAGLLARNAVRRGLTVAPDHNAASAVLLKIANHGIDPCPLLGIERRRSGCNSGSVHARRDGSTQGRHHARRHGKPVIGHRSGA
jgi:hypothetical protein